MTFPSASLGVALVVMAVIFVLRDHRRHLKSEAGFERVRDELKKALEAATKEHAIGVIQADDLRSLNRELLEMRSALVNVLEDVEESKKRIERDFRRDTAIFTAIGVAIVAADRNRRIFLFNPEAASVTGVSVEKAMGTRLDQVVRFIHQDASAPDTNAVAQAFEGVPVKLSPRQEALNADGRRIPVTGTASPFFDEQNRLQGAVVQFRDVTIERDVDRQKSGFISIASHQLRTPLSSIRWFVDLLLAGDAGKLTKQQREFLTDIYTSTTRMINLVGDLLNVSRIESGGAISKPEPTDLKDMLESIADDFVGLLRQHKLTLVPKLAAGTPRVMLDAGAVRQAITNLIANAVNYTAENGTITMGLIVKGQEVVASVTDTGIGIPDAQKHRIFERFFRAENAVSRETVGSGMGPFITKLMVEANQGRIWFESNEGQGSTFFVAFPIALAEPAKAG